MKRLLAAVPLAALLPLAAPAIEGWRVSTFEIEAWRALAPVSGDTAVCSPVGLAAAVCSLGEAGNAELRAGMAERLRLMSEFSAAFANIHTAYEALGVSNRAVAVVAPSVWTAHTRSMDKDYVALLQNSYNGTAGVLVDTLSINAWTATMTDGLVPEMMASLPLNPDIHVCCAAACEAAWRRPFKVVEDKTLKFRPEGGGSARSAVFRRGDEDDVVRLDYENYSVAAVPLAADNLMLILVKPAEGRTLADLQDKYFTDDALDLVKTAINSNYGEGLSKGRCTVTIPELSINSSADILKRIKALGAPSSGYTALGPEHKLTGATLKTALRLRGAHASLTPGESAVDELVRRAAEDAKERRRAKKGEDYPPDIAPFTCDTPFMFAIWERRSDTLVVCGHYR